MAINTQEALSAVTEAEVVPTEAHISLAKFLTENTPVEVSPEQAWAFIIGHRIWQSGDERKAELAALREAKAKESEEKKAEREQKAAERKAEAERKKEAAEAKKRAKEAEEAGDDSDIETEDEDGADVETEAVAAPKRRRTGKAAKTQTAQTGEF